MVYDKKFWEILQKRAPILCVDPVIINHKREVLLTRRAVPPFVGFWHNPGGVVEFGEKVETAAVREAFEETGLRVKIVKLIGVYSAKSRDPRGHFVTCAFLAKPVGGQIAGDFQSSEIKYFKKLPDKIGFDHRQIIKDALKLYDENI